MTPSRSLFPFLFSLFFVGVFVWQLSEAFFGYGRSTHQARIFPVAIGLPFLALTLTAAGIEFRHWLAGRRLAVEKPPESDTPPVRSAEVERRRTTVIIAWIVGFYLVIWLLGFMLAAPLLTLLYIKLAGKEAWPLALAMTAGVWLFFSGLFQCTLHIPLMERLPGELFLRLESLIGVELNQYFLVPFLC